MLRKTLLLLIAFIIHLSAFAQEDSSHLRISLLTCGPGDEEVYEVFGHTAVRIIDSVRHTDIVYNYGTFEYGPNFEMQFMRGKLLYCLATESFNSFMQEYVEANRSVQEQVLLPNWKQKELIQYFLNWNAAPENKYYKYDFFFDNCATRIRDIFPRPEVFGKAFHFAETRPPGSDLTFRDIINRYFYRDHWTRLGVNILLGSRIDKVMSNADIMFLPDYLRDGIAGATVNGQKISTPPVIILPGNSVAPAGINESFIFTSLLCLLTIAGLCIKRLRLLGKIMSALLLFTTGLLGCLILVMWFGTDHQGCADNYNLLWCLPTNLIIAFFNPKGKSRYALIAIGFIFISLLLHIVKAQGLIPEFFPLLLALLFIYGTIYRNRNREPLPKTERKNSLVYYRKMGTGPAVILLHGFPESGTLWKNICDPLSKSATLIIPDLPGSGKSILESDMSISDMADSVKAVMDKEGINKAVFAGHSMGGYVALAFADKYPDKVAGLSLVHSTPLADDEEKKIMRLKSIDLIRRGGKNAFMNQVVPNLFSDAFKQSNPEIVKTQTELALTMQDESIINFYNAMKERNDLRNMLEKSVFPVQWIAGINDNLISYKKILELCYRSGVNFVSFYNNCGHMSMLEAPVRLTDDLQAFINYCYP